jgi:hypothetical protein
MGFLDAIWHLLNFFAPAVVVAAFAAMATKLLWWRELKGVSAWWLSASASAASACVLVAGLVGWGRDGKMATYAAMSCACALALWWAGWGRRRG